MTYNFIHFPTNPPSGNPFGFIKPIGRQSRLDPSHDIGVIAHGPYDIVDVGSLLALQEQLNRTAVPPADKHLTVAAFDSTIPLAYGHIKVPALLANAVTYNGYWHFWSLWSRGEIDAVETVYINDAVPGFGNLQSVTGTPTQTIMGSLFLPMTVWYQAKFGGSQVFDQAALNIAYSDVIAPVADIEQPPQINAILRGKKVYDPRAVYQVLATPSTWTYSRNPALALADFLRSTVYGAGVAVDDNSLITAANACDTAGRTLDILIDRKSQLSDWVATLQQAANCFLDKSETSVRLIPDELTSSVLTLTHAGGQIVSLEQEATEARNNLPTVIEIVYTDAREPTWKEATVLIKRDGVDDGTTPWRKSTVRMPWIVETGDGAGEALATKEGYLRMNKTWLRLPNFTIQVLDEGVQPVVGDAITLTYPDSGYASLQVKISGSQPTQNGWALGVFYDDPNAYVDDAIAPPTDPGWPPSPFTVPAVRRLTAVEDATDPKLIASWQPPIYHTLAGDVDWPYIKDYPITFELIGGSPSLADSGNARPRASPSFTSVDLIPGQDYLITVWVRSIFGQLGPPTSIIAHVNAVVYTAFRYRYLTPTLVNMVAQVDLSDGHTYWVTDMGDLWDTNFPNLLDSYTDPLATYHTPGTSTLTTETADAAATYTGDWVSTLLRADISGVGAGYLEINPSASTPLTRHPAPLFNGAGRYVALSSEATGSGTQRVDDLGEVSLTVTR